VPCLSFCLRLSKMLERNLGLREIRFDGMHFQGSTFFYFILFYFFFEDTVSLYELTKRSLPQDLGCIPIHINMGEM